MQEMRTLALVQNKTPAEVVW